MMKPSRLRIRPLGGIHDSAHNEPDALAIYLPDLSGSNESIELISLHAGNCFVFLACPYRSVGGISKSHQADRGLALQPPAYPTA
jgi:hypothetical protein